MNLLKCSQHTIWLPHLYESQSTKEGDRLEYRAGKLALSLGYLERPITKQVYSLMWPYITCQEMLLLHVYPCTVL